MLRGPDVDRALVLLLILAAEHAARLRTPERERSCKAPITKAESDF